MRSSRLLHASRGEGHQALQAGVSGTGEGGVYLRSKGSRLLHEGGGEGHENLETSVSSAGVKGLCGAWRWRDEGQPSVACWLW